MRDNYDLWLENEARLQKQLERLPLCFQCGEHIQQETAVCIDGDWYCDNCLLHYRKDTEDGYFD